MNSPTVVVRNLSKTFAGQQALHEVDLEIEAGEIRALVGQNGSGKSTLIKVLAGYHDPDPGARVEIDGQELVFGDPHASEQAGLRFVHQDLGLVHDLDTVDNLALGHGYDVGRTRTINWRKERRLAREAIERLDHDFDVRRPVGELAMSERTAVAIARALAPRRTTARLLVLDEPTASLPSAEVERLYELVRTVSDSEVAVLFVSHHLEEVFDLSETVTVLRDGHHVATRPLQGLTEPELVELVVGRELEEHHAHISEEQDGSAVLTLRGVAGQVVQDLDLEVRAGEVVGVAGLTGSGREELAGLIFGGAARTGRIEVDGSSIPPQRPDVSIAAGAALIPADRHTNAAFMQASLRENLTVVDPSRHLVGGFLRKGPERADAFEWLDRLDVRPNRPEQDMETLSGGNQQKLVVARWLRQEPKVLILDEPTQGVDVGAKVDIYKLIDNAAEHGTAVLVLSTDHEELATVCDRVIVLQNGRINDEYQGAALTADHLTASVLGPSRGSAA